MAEKSLEDQKSLIISLYNEEHSEEEIAEFLCNRGTKTTFSEIQQHLENWRLIPSPSPVLSKDADDPIDPPQQDRLQKLDVTCQHRMTSHISYTNLANIPSDSTSIQKYEQDLQSHEFLAYSLQRPQTQSQTPTRVEEQGEPVSPLIPESDVNLSTDDEIFTNDDYAKIFKEGDLTKIYKVGELAKIIKEYRSEHSRISENSRVMRPKRLRRAKK